MTKDFTGPRKTDHRSTEYGSTDPVLRAHQQKFTLKTEDPYRNARLATAPTRQAALRQTESGETFPILLPK